MFANPHDARLRRKSRQTKPRFLRNLQPGPKSKAREKLMPTTRNGSLPWHVMLNYCCHQLLSLHRKCCTSKELGKKRQNTGNASDSEVWATVLLVSKHYLHSKLYASFWASSVRTKLWTFFKIPGLLACKTSGPAASDDSKSWAPRRSAQNFSFVEDVLRPAARPRSLRLHFPWSTSMGLSWLQFFAQFCRSSSIICRRFASFWTVCKIML